MPSPKLVSIVDLQDQCRWNIFGTIFSYDLIIHTVYRFSLRAERVVMNRNPTPHLSAWTGWLPILALTLTVYILATQILPPISGTLSYYTNPLLWGILIFITLTRFKKQKKYRWHLDKPLVVMAVTVATFQISASVIVGLFTSFGRSPFSSEPQIITTNLAYFISMLFGLELPRAYLIKSWERKATLAIGVTALLFAQLSASFLPVITLSSPFELTKFLSEKYLPSVAENLLASYLALLGGPIASISYMGTILTFQWLSPILPDPSWSIKALLGVIAPTIGFLIIHNFHTTPTQTTKPEKLHTPHWTAISIIFVLAVWASTGQLGFYPTAIISGSMQPTIDVGDLVIVTKISPEKIKPGDIIQFKGERENIVHRVVAVQQGATKTFITKGDNNNSPDREPVKPDQILGKVTYIVPKIGWASIIVKTAIEKIRVLLENLAFAP
ncbi:MAG: signal peptidase I [Candidatus Bathyarchaeia archaeon]